MASADLMADDLTGKKSTKLSMVQRFQSMMKGQDEFPQRAAEAERYGGLHNFRADQM